MRKILLLLFACCTTFLFIESASAAGTWNGCFPWTGCHTTVAVDSGTAKQCISTGCGCGDWGGGGCPARTVSYSSSCPAGYTDKGIDATGQSKCCINTSLCLRGDEGSPSLDQVQSANDYDLGEVLSPAQTAAYWGYYGSSTRSSNTGRVTSAGARLDVCLGYGDVDTITSLASNDADRYSLCTGSTYGCATPSKNEYCQASGSTVCIDRCACYYSANGVDTCNNL